ncbi:SusE domain-containing protein [Spirosoma sp.]|uniref:SusE domain-containing protein n=1 Tax=Spirosoma sp. TaxID=1899569 RepID=UPI003B3A78E9
MKQTLTYGSMALVAMLSIASCTQTVRELNPAVTPVSSLMTPDNNTSVRLEPGTPASVQFKWGPTQTAEGVLYEVAFDKVDGDFSKPFYKTVSDGLGVQPQLTLSHNDLKKIAALGGIAASSTGSVKWTVLASIALNRQMSTTTRILTMTRPAGFAELPDSLYLTGSATEGGEDVTKSIAFKKTEDGVFEAFTSLKAGTYYLTDRRTGSGKNYYVAKDTVREGNTPVTLTGATKTYRLRYDFNIATAQATEIQSVGLFMSAYNKEIGTLTYAGNGTWTAASIPVEFYPFSWGRDERYKFVMHTANGLAYLGSANVNNNSPAGAPASYFQVQSVSDAQWDNTYKFDPTADGKKVKVDLVLRANAPYTHQVTVLK